MARFALVIVCALALAASGASAGMDELRAKLAQKFQGGIFGHHHRGHSGSNAAASAGASAYGGYSGAAAASASASGSGAAAAAASVQRQAYAPAAYGNNMAFNRFQAAPAYGGYSGSAAAASAVGGAGGASSAGATTSASGGFSAGSTGAVSNEYQQNVAYNPAPTSYSAAAGTFAGTGRGSESSSYKRATENIDSVESGRADDNHYYNAQSYGKAMDDNSHEAFNDNDEDVIHTPTMFHSKKKSVNYVNDKNKSLRESGSGVMAHDKHSSAYNKKFRRFNENVDQQNRREGDGFVSSSNSQTATNFGDEDEMAYDSDGLGTFQGVNGERPMPYQGGAAMGAGAASSVGGGSVATSAALAGRGGSAAAAAAAAAANGYRH